MNLYERILNYNNSDINALYYNNKSISYKQMMINIRKMANFLSLKGIKKGDVVTVVLPNIPVTIYTFYALLPSFLILFFQYNAVHKSCFLHALIQRDKGIPEKNFKTINGNPRNVLIYLVVPVSLCCIFP